MMRTHGIKGLTDEEVTASRLEYGWNRIPVVSPPKFQDKVLEAFEDPLIRILLGALCISLTLAFFGYSNWMESIGILTSIVVATLVSSYSEFRSDNSFRILQAQASQMSYTVIRGESIETVDTTELCVGDYILIRAGDRVPVDGKLIHGRLEIDQATLTGETKPVTILPTSDIKDNVFKGTIVLDGEAVIKAHKVGIATSYGQLAEYLQGSHEERCAPLRVKLEHLANFLAKVAYIGAIFIAISFLFKQFIMDNNYEWKRISIYITNYEIAFRDVVQALILSLIVIVVAVPEGLPMMIAVVLSLNMRKLLSKQVLVRRLLGIETAGCITLLLVDKTGTLTEGVFKPAIFVSGSGYKCNTIDDIPSELSKLLSFAIAGTSSTLIGKSKNHNNEFKVAGSNATDRALMEFVGLKHLTPYINGNNGNDIVNVEKNILFSSVRKFSASQVNISSTSASSFITLQDSNCDLIRNNNNNDSNVTVTLVKGAAETIIQNCVAYYSDDGHKTCFTQKYKDKLMKELNILSLHGHRVLAIATCGEKIIGSDTQSFLSDHLTLIGVVGVTDVVRSSSAGSIEAAKRAGIHVIMITGDKKETAIAVARDVGLLSNNNNNNDDNDIDIKKDTEMNGEILTSNQLNGMSDKDIETILPRLSVIARALPADKTRLVKVAQNIIDNNGHHLHVIGMTGDGVNDSAALKQADVSFAMGSGSEVAKEASDIVILDDNFYSILQAVLFGRTIFKSIRKFITFQSTINLASTIIVFVGPFLGFDLPLTMIQLLWLNLVMDTLAALAFGGEPALNIYLLAKPISRHEKLISKEMFHGIIVNGLFIAICSAIFLTWDRILVLFSRKIYDDEEEINENEGGVVFLTAFFCFFIFICTMNAFNIRTTEMNLFNNIGANKTFVFIIFFICIVQILFTEIGGNWVRTVPLTWKEWSYIFIFSLSIIPFDMMRKLYYSSSKNSLSLCTRHEKRK